MGHPRDGADKLGLFFGCWAQNPLEKRGSLVGHVDPAPDEIGIPLLRGYHRCSPPVGIP